MPEPPPPPPGWIPPSSRVRAQQPNIRPPSYYGTYPSIPIAVPARPPSSWNRPAQPEITIRNRHLGPPTPSRSPNRTPVHTPLHTPYSTPPQTPTTPQNQGWATPTYQRSERTTPISPIISPTQPQRNIMQVRTPSYDYRGPIIKQETLKPVKQVENSYEDHHWLEAQVPPDTSTFALIGETLLCPIKVAIYILGELFSRAR